MPSYSGGPASVSGDGFVFASGPNFAYAGGYPGSSLSLNGLTGTIVCTGPSTQSVIVAETVSEMGAGQDSPDPTSTSATTYKVYDGSSGTITLTSPSLSASVSAGPEGGIMIVNCGYSAQVYPVTIRITGDDEATSDTTFLVGQYVNASLDTGGAPTSPSDTYSWTISGAQPFDNFIASDGSGRYYPLWSTQSSSNSAVWSHFAHPDSATFSCQATIHGLPVSATISRGIEAPKVYTDDLIGSTEAIVLPNPTRVQLIRLEAGAGTGNARGFDWTNTGVAIPSGYDITGYNPGSWNWTQLWMPSRTETNYAGVQEYIISTTAGSLSGQEVLDTGYPYLHEWFLADATRDGDSDSPYEDLPYDGNGVPSPSIAKVNVTDTFRDFLMYMPPGGTRAC